MRPSTSLVRALAAPVFALACLLSACGGGGSDSPAEATLAVTLDLSRLTVSAPSASSTFTPVTARLSAVPSGSVFPFIVADQAVLVDGATTAQRNADGSYTVILQTRTGLAVGAYTGTLTLKFCKDVACASAYPLTGNTLPYQVSIVAPLVPAVTVNGVGVALPAPGFSVPVRRDDRIVITAGEPSTWADSPTAAAMITGRSATTSTWSATVTATSGLFFVDLASVATPLNAAQVSFLVN